MVTRNTKAKSYLGAPEPYDAVTEDWTAYVANRVTKDGQSYTFFGSSEALFSYSLCHKSLASLVTLMQGVHH